MFQHLRPALVLTALFTLLTGLAYPLVMTGAAKALAPRLAGGSLIVRDGTVVGSSLVGQNFTADRYFHGRPSATSSADPNDASKTIAAPYNAANSSGSNLGPTSKALVERVKGDVEALREAGGAAVPVDAVTASASGIDPDISPAFALLQVDRVAKARGLAAERVRALVERRTERPLVGFVGEPRVNVLLLNLALDGLS